jgi:hypothetical protein
VHVAVRDRQVDRDVMAADAPRPRRGRPRLAEHGEPVALRIAPLPAGSAGGTFEVAEHRLESDDRRDLTCGPGAGRCGHDRGRGGPLIRAHVGDREAVARRLRRVRPDESLGDVERE